MEAARIPSTPPTTKVVKILSPDRAESTSRSKFHMTAVTGTRKLPSSTSVGIRLTLAVSAVTMIDAIQRTSPTRKTTSQRQRGRPAGGPRGPVCSIRGSDAIALIRGGGRLPIPQYQHEG